MNHVDIDTKQIMQMFSEFNQKLRKKTFATALRKSSNILKKEAVKNLKQSVKHVNRKDKYGNSLSGGIKISIAKNKQSAKVHIMNNFKLKFFELGTNDRYAKRWRRKLLRKKRYLGKINPTKFFTKAKQAKEGEVFQSIEQHLINTIRKINEKYMKRQ